MLVSTVPEDLPCLVGILLGGSGGIKKLLTDVARRSGTALGTENEVSNGELERSSEVVISRRDVSLRQGSEYEKLGGLCCNALAGCTFWNFDGVEVFKEVARAGLYRGIYARPDLCARLSGLKLENSFPFIPGA